ncbi:molybdopterin/thiamine biosynthesis adenylyltransferase [Blastomonas natatoria]|uniref:Molybdopterin/thiamine biosynthesis adenylyltransferase n=2 Tax=Blastomonas natatoria TaxID=34015 RepID=A0A2V3UPB2_9SPHN|nr:molybdopterin/thiamine biosynthesis adenylyltransferase [Blastomonas natatoria]
MRPAEVAAYCYQEALSLVLENEAGRNTDDFHLDFSAYWRRQLENAPAVWVWLGRDQSSRLVAAWHGQAFTLIAENEDDCQSWLNHRFGPKKERSVRSALVVGLDALPSPSDYPVNGGKLRRLIAKSAPDSLAIFDRFVSSMSGNAVVVLGGKTLDGEPAWAPVIVSDGISSSGGKSRAGALRGFRTSRKPPALQVLDRGVKRASPTLVDAYISRLEGGLGEGLAAKRVVIFGCGSLGAGVAKILLQSGIRRMVLVDPENLGWENIARHELGGDSVGKAKATELANRFTLMYPHVREILATVDSWQSLARRDPGVLTEADLILSLIGDWNSEAALNDLQRAPGGAITAPILYGWLEEHAGAAHALAIGKAGSCFRCGFDTTGGATVPATKWTSKGPNVCGGATSVYGAVELAPSQALVASLAIDLLLGRASAPVRRSWLAPRSTIGGLGGRINAAWESVYGDVECGGRMMAAPWPQKVDCSCSSP